VKKNIISLMLKAPEAIQRQLSDAITAIGKACMHVHVHVYVENGVMS